MVEYEYSLPGVFNLAQIHTMVHKIDPFRPDEQVIACCARVVRGGGLVAFPTETVYGLGANAYDPEAVSRVFQVKDRPRGNPLILHVSDFDQVNALLADIWPEAEKLMEAFWPGPLTLLFPKPKDIPDLVTANLPTVAVRMPDHPVSKMLIRACGMPLVAPSANRSGRPSSTSAQDVLSDLGGKIDVVLDGGRTFLGMESTVLDLSGDSPVILRPGGVSREEIETVLGLAPGSVLTSVDGVVLTPGAKYKHYVPEAEVHLAGGTVCEQRRKLLFHALRLAFSGTRVALLASHENYPFYQRLKKATKGLLQVINLGSRDNLPQVAAGLYSALRQSEEQGVKVILSETFEPRGIGLAIDNRLKKASRGRSLLGFDAPLRMLMVCTGNTCRSPMAEGIMAKWWEKVGEPYPLKVASGGLAALPGLPASSEAVDVMKDMGIDISGHLSGGVSGKVLACVDLVIVMTRGHEQMLKDMYPEYASKILMLSEISPEIHGDVIDPFGKGPKEYGDTAGLLEESLSSMARWLAGQKT